MGKTKNSKTSTTRPKAKVCEMPDCDSPIHHRDKHTKCILCLSPTHFTCSYRYNKCAFCKSMAGSLYQECKLIRKRLLRSPGDRSLAQSLISIATGGAQPSVDGEAGQGSVLQGSCSSSDEESIPESQGNHSTHYIGKVRRRG